MCQSFDILFETRDNVFISRCCCCLAEHLRLSIRVKRSTNRLSLAGNRSLQVHMRASEMFSPLRSHGTVTPLHIDPDILNDFTPGCAGRTWIDSRFFNNTRVVFQKSFDRLNQGNLYTFDHTCIF